MPCGSMSFFKGVGAWFAVCCLGYVSPCVVPGEGGSGFYTKCNLHVVFWQSRYDVVHVWTC